MKRFIPFLLLLMVASLSFAQSPLGRWRTKDDRTGRTKSIVRISESGGVLSGVVEELIDPNAQRTCSANCPPDKRNRPVVGLGVIWGMRRNGNEWSGGQILDPKDGKVYRCKIWVEGNTLKVRGYIGPFFRTQTWEKAD